MNTEDSSMPSPMPVPTAFGVQKIQAPDSSSLIMMVISTVTGQTIVFFDLDTARQIADRITEEVSGIHIPNTNLTLPGAV